MASHQLPEGVTRRDMFSVPVDMIVVDPEHNYTDSDRGDIAALAASIAESGVHNPVRCYKDGDGKYVLIAGFRRMAAVAMVNKGKKSLVVEKIPVIVEDRYSNDADHDISQMLENAHREDATPIQRAGAYRKMIDVHGLDEGEIAKRLGEKPENVKRLLGILAAPSVIRKAVENGQLSVTAAAAIVAKHKDDADGMKKALDVAITASGSRKPGKATVRGTTKATRTRKVRTRTRSVKEIAAAIDLIASVIGGKEIGNDRGLFKLEAAQTTLMWVVGDEDAPWSGIEAPKKEKAAKATKAAAAAPVGDADPRQTSIVE